MPQKKSYVCWDCGRIAHCMYQPEVRDRYPNADEAYLAVDVFDHHTRAAGGQNRQAA